MKTVSHAGDAGDIIYACATMRALAKHWKDQVELVIHPAPAINYVRSPATPESVDKLAPLIAAQPYVGFVRYSEEPEGTRLDTWRMWWPQIAGYGITLCAAHLLEHRIDPRCMHQPWLTVPDPKPIAPVVIHRSARYHNPNFPWKVVLEKYGHDAVMVGLPDEHQAFVDEFGFVNYQPTDNFLQLARVIAGAKLFIGNQSSPYAIAEGLKMNTIQETWIGEGRECGDANCVFPRGNALYVTGDTLMLPEVA